MQHSVSVLLHNVRSTHNVGSIFRTADAAGVERIYLSGYTPTPRDRFGRVQKDVAKTALGAESAVPWEYAKSPSSLFKKWKQEGKMVVGIERDARAIDYRTFTRAQPTVFVFGNEVRGLSRALCSACDQLVEIPMHGTKESLNVSVAAGIVLFSAIS